MSWKEFLSHKRSKNELILTLFLLTIVLFLLTKFLVFVEARNGVSFNDPILGLFEPIDLTWLTFTLIYGSLIGALFYLLPRPEKFLFAIELYILMVVTRIIAMWLLPLNPPEKTLILVDPFVEFFGTGKTLTKDLFFSGHTATLFILFLSTDAKALKKVFLISTIGVAVSVLLQHVHYTIDVIAALFFTYACYSVLKSIKMKVK